MKHLTPRRAISLPTAAVLLLFATGCQDVQKASVQGLVTMDGAPMDHGSILFIAGSKTTAESAPGSIRKDGTYSVQIGQSGKLFVGEYRVVVTARGPSTPHPQGGPPTPGDPITPERYADPETTPLRFNVRAGENTLDIPLVSDSPSADDVEENYAGEEAAEEVETNEGSADKPAADLPEASTEEATSSVGEEANAQ